MMNEWLIVPRDPLIFRDGKPFTATPGERSNSLPFPFPSTLIGAVRTRAGTDSQGKFDSSQLNDLLAKSMHGPVLVELGADGAIVERYFPAPADALLVEANDKGNVQRYALAPIQTPGDARTNLTGLQLVGHNPQATAPDVLNNPILRAHCEKEQAEQQFARHLDNWWNREQGGT